jgi:hypothetical protein
MTEVHKDFMCRCSDAEVAKIEGIIARAKAKYAEGSANRFPHPLDDTNIVTHIVYSLSMDFDAHIKEIYADQWCMVTAEAFAHGESEPKFRTMIQCDRVEDGIMATWLAFADRFPERLVDDED